VATGKNFGNFNNNLPPKDPTLVPDKGSPQKVGTPIVWTAGAPILMETLCSSGSL